MANAVSHDQNFKNLILHYPRHALTFFAQPFGAVAPAVADRLDRGSASDLEAWSENLLDARTPEDVFGPRD